jgi:hypothetical protein
MADQALNASFPFFSLERQKLAQNDKQMPL